MDSVGQARNFIQQLYTFRKRLSEESPELAAPFFLVDLRLHDIEGNIITGKATSVPQRAIIRPYKPGWKDQLQQQLAASGRGVGEGAKLLEPLVSVKPSGSMLEKLPVPANPAESGVNSTDALSETLSDLGYSTEEGK